MQQLVGIISGVLTSISMLPQFIKLIREKDSENVSSGMLAVLIAGVAGWVWYGSLKNDLIIICTNGFACMLNLITLVLSLRYKRNTRSKLGTA
ncbi:MAG TPA: SemiSWEET transporter [Chitinophagaceae bacterium]